MDGMTEPAGLAFISAVAGLVCVYLAGRLLFLRQHAGLAALGASVLWLGGAVHFARLPLGFDAPVLDTADLRVTSPVTSLHFDPGETRLSKEQQEQLSEAIHELEQKDRKLVVRVAGPSADPEESAWADSRAQDISDYLVDHDMADLVIVDDRAASASDTVVVEAIHPELETAEAPAAPPIEDTDRDGVMDAVDACPGTTGGGLVDARGCVSAGLPPDPVGGATIPVPTPTYAVHPNGPVKVEYPKAQTLTLLVAIDRVDKAATARRLEELFDVTSPRGGLLSMPAGRWPLFKRLKAVLVGCEKIKFLECEAQSPGVQPTEGRSEWVWHWSLRPRAAPESEELMSIQVTGITAPGQDGAPGKEEPIAGVPPLTVSVELTGATWWQQRLAEAGNLLDAFTQFLNKIPGFIQALSAAVLAILGLFGYMLVKRTRSDPQ